MFLCEALSLPPPLIAKQKDLTWLGDELIRSNEKSNKTENKQLYLAQERMVGEEA